MAKTRLDLRKEDGAEVGLHWDTYSPGDGVTRYRFFLEECDYFARSGIYTALGIKEANTYITGFLAGAHSACI